jgi:hypothetical protein
LKNGDTKFVKQDSFYYWGHVFNKYFAIRRCILCNDKVCELSDISFGDAWLPELQNSRLGESVIISRTEIGQKLIEDALLKEKIELKKISCDKVIECQALDEVKKRLEARFFVSRMLGKQVPTYNQKFLKSGVRAYFSAMLVFLRASISSKQSLWKFIDTYPFFLRGIRRKPYESDNIK